METLGELEKYPLLYELAVKRTEEQGNKPCKRANLNYSGETFYWTDTEEGSRLWRNVYHDDLDLIPEEYKYLLTKEKHKKILKKFF